MTYSRDDSDRRHQADLLNEQLENQDKVDESNLSDEEVAELQAELNEVLSQVEGGAQQDT